MNDVRAGVGVKKMLHQVDGGWIIDIKQRVRTVDVITANPRISSSPHNTAQHADRSCDLSVT